MDTNDSGDTSAGRSKRQKVDKKGRLAALQKLKGLKGTKHKYEVDEVTKVWDEVDEKDYSKIVRDRQDEDWIVDDDGAGYAEDGHEIFDDEFEGDSQSKDNRRSSKGQSKKLALGDTSRASKGRDIKSMFKAMPAKKSCAQKTDKSEDDNLLDDILQDLHSDVASDRPVIKPTVLMKKKVSAYTPSPKLGSANGNSGFRQNDTDATPPRAVTRKPMRPRLVTYEDVPDAPRKEEAALSKKPIDSNSRLFNSKTDQNHLAKSDDNIEEFESEFDDFGNDDDFEIDDSTQSNEVKTVPVTNKDDVRGRDVNAKPKTDVNMVKTVTATVNENDNLADVFKDDWNNIFGTNLSEDQSKVVGTEPTAAPASSHYDNSKLPITKNEQGESVVSFYWFDAYEDFFKHPGIVYLFGKAYVESTKSFISCCVVVRNIERKVFVLPREHKFHTKTKSETDAVVDFCDVYNEFNKILTDRFKILEFRSKKVVKRYCFDQVQAPDEADYLEAKYNAKYAALPAELAGETFSHVFGTNTSSLEQLLLDQCIKGPCWLEIKNPQISSPQISWCKMEVEADKPENVVVAVGKRDAPPPLVVLTLCLKTVINPKSQQSEIITVSCLSHRDFRLDKPAPNPPFQDHFCALTRPFDAIFPFNFKNQLAKNNCKVEAFESERALLGFLLAKILQIDPDVIVGHDIVYFDLDVLLHRLQVNKIPNWSRVGRLRRTIFPKFTGNRISSLLCGRLLCDVKILGKELIRSKSYDLTELVKVVLRKERVELDICKAFESSHHLINFVEWSLLDASYCLQIICDMNALPLALQITNIAGNVMSRTLLGGRAERNEFLLLHAFTEKGYIAPDKQFNKFGGGATAKAYVDGTVDADTMENDAGRSKSATSSRRPKAAYAGGLVLEPKKGFYDKYILLMDFNSLYPSIIQEYNVCFTTMRSGCSSENDQSVSEDLSIPDTNAAPGILPMEIRKLVESRRQVKGLLNNPSLSNDLKAQYDIRQKALKLTANSMYGCLGFSNSRFYAKPLAAFVTSKGREILLQTKNVVQKINLDVIYGDTDSLMINSNSTDFDHVMKLGNKLKQEINKTYRHLEIEIDGVYKSMLLLKKKKYAALSIQKLPNGEMVTSEEIKGVDIVRRDWSDVACDAGKFVISQILSDKAREQILTNIIAHLTELKELIASGSISNDKLTITKQLTKNPEDYPDKKSLPHVSVAIRLNAKGGKKIKQGDTVAYVICEDGSNLPATQRSYHLDELKTNTNLKIDKNYYLANQVHPVISRLCDPIDGLDAACIAQCLGLDPSGFRSRPTYGGGMEAEEEAMLGEGTQSFAEKFEHCERFKFVCPAANCKQENVFDGPFRGEGSLCKCALSACSNNNCELSPATYVGKLCNRLTLDIRRHIQKYYQGWMVCDDNACGNRTRKLPIRFEKCKPLCGVCEKGHLCPEFTDKQLYVQLCFYQYVFDTEKAVKHVKAEEKDELRPEIRRLQREYGRLKSVASRFLQSSAYSVVDLNNLFGDMFANFNRTGNTKPSLNESFQGSTAVATSAQ